MDVMFRCGSPPTARCGGGGVLLFLLAHSSQSAHKPLPAFHSWPINPVVWLAYQKDKSFLWRPYLEDGFPLRCFA